MALDVVEFPEDIAWLDLSFNGITEISDDILQFQALKMIYLVSMFLNFFPLLLTTRHNKLEHLSLEFLSRQAFIFKSKATANPIGGPFRCLSLG